MNRSYETIFIADAHLSNEQIETLINKFSKIITDNNGIIKHIDRWGKRRLAYEIAKKQYGYYVYVRFDSEGSLVKMLEREFRLDDNIIRYLTVLVPRCVVDNEGDFVQSGASESEEDQKIPEKDQNIPDDTIDDETAAADNESPETTESTNALDNETDRE